MVTRVALVGLVAGCLSKPAEPAFRDGGDVVGDGRSDGSVDGMTADAAIPPIMHVGVFCRNNTSGTSTNCTAAAGRQGDAVVLLVGCIGGNSAPTYSVTAPGWTFIQLAKASNTSARVYAAALGAIAPDASTATFTATATGCQTTTSMMGDEFTNNDPTSATTTFDSSGMNTGTGNASATLTTHSASSAVWAAVKTNGSEKEVPPFISGTNYNGDQTEYITSAPTNTQETAMFQDLGNGGSPSTWAAAIVAIKWRGP